MFLKTLNKQISKKQIPFLVSLFLTLLTLFIHLQGFTSSMINKGNFTIDYKYLISVIDYHKLHPAFSKRPLSTFLIENLSNLIGIEVGVSFILVNFFFLFLSGIFLYYLSIRILRNKIFGLLNMLIYFFSFSNLFVFFTPIYTYDEPLQFSLLFLSLIFLYDKKWKFLLLIISIISINYIFSYKIYKFSFVSQNSNYINEYLFISILLISIHFLFLHFSNKTEE